MSNPKEISGIHQFYAERMCEKSGGKKKKLCQSQQIGFGDLGGLFQPEEYHDSNVLPGEHRGFVLFNLLLDNKTDVHTVSYFR